MPLSRRDSLRAAAGLGLSVGLAGCLSTGFGSAGSVARAYDRARGVYERGPRQGRADPLTLDQPLTVDDADLEYLPKKDAVRFPSLMNQSGVVASDTMPFGRWAQLQCAEAGVDAVWDVVASRIDGEPTGLGRGAASSVPSMVVELSHTTVVHDAGEVVSEPPLSFDELVDVTPASVTATVTLDDRAATHTVPVQVVGGEAVEGEWSLNYESEREFDVRGKNETANATTE